MKVLFLLSVTLYTIWRVSAHDYNICARGEIAYHQMCGGFEFFHLPPCGNGQICRLYPRSYYGRCCKRIIIAPKRLSPCLFFGRECSTYLSMKHILSADASSCTHASRPRVGGCPSGSVPVEASCGGFIGASCPWGTFCVKPPKTSNGVCCKWW